MAGHSEAPGSPGAAADEPRTKDPAKAEEAISRGSRLSADRNQLTEPRAV